MRWPTLLTLAALSLISARPASAQESSPAAPPESTETRYVNGTEFHIVTHGDLQVWMALARTPEAWGTSGSLQAMIYVINDSERPVTIFPEQVTVDIVKQSRSGPEYQRLKTFAADDYEQKLRNQNLGTQFLAIDFTGASAPREQTSRTKSAYEIKDQNGLSVGSIAYTGTTTQTPSTANEEARRDRARARSAALRDELDASFASIVKTLMRRHTLDPHTSYGGMVYMNERGRKPYVLTVPFGEKSFAFNFDCAK